MFGRLEMQRTMTNKGSDRHAGNIACSLAPSQHPSINHRHNAVQFVTFGQYSKRRQQLAYTCDNWSHRRRYPPSHGMTGGGVNPLKRRGVNIRVRRCMSLAWGARCTFCHINNSAVSSRLTSAWPLSWLQGAYRGAADWGIACVCAGWGGGNTPALTPLSSFVSQTQ